MGNGPLPIGSMHSRDFFAMPEQRPFSTLTADDQGFVRFACLKCPRTGKIALAKLQERFSPDAGLVNVLNVIAPKDCPLAGPDAWGNHPCGFCYRDPA